MSWTFWPRTQSHDSRQFKSWLEMNYAFWERKIGFSGACSTQPGSNFIFETGIIGSVTNTTLTDPGKEWYTDLWAGAADDAGLPLYPNNFCVILNGLDFDRPDRIVRADRVASNTATVITFLSSLGLTAAELSA